MMGNVVL